MPAHQLPGALDGVPDVEQLADQRLDPAQRPALVTGEPVHQRAFPQLSLQPGLLLRAQPLPRHRTPGPKRRGPAVLPGPPPPPHRPRRNPQVVRDLVNPVSPDEPPSGLQPQPLTPLLLRGCVPASLRIPHVLVLRPQPADVTTRSLRVQTWLAQLVATASAEPKARLAVAQIDRVQEYAIAIVICSVRQSLPEEAFSLIGATLDSIRGGSQRRGRAS